MLFVLKDFDRQILMFPQGLHIFVLWPLSKNNECAIMDVLLCLIIIAYQSYINIFEQCLSLRNLCLNWHLQCIWQLNYTWDALAER
jgi:hypothetical protein